MMTNQPTGSTIDFEIKTTALTDKDLLKELKKRITLQVGKRCKETYPFCFVCQCWDAYDVLKEASKLWENK